MHIAELQMKNFGKFSDKKILFHDGINVISGNNEMGKTTMHSFIRGMFFGIPKQRGRASRNDEYSLREPWENGSYYAGVLRFESGGKLFRLERNFQKREKSASLVCETDGEELSLENGDLESILEGFNEASFTNTVFIPQKGSATDEGLAAELRNYMANIQNSGDSDIDVSQALEKLYGKRRRLESEKKKLLIETMQSTQELQMRLDYMKQETQQLARERAELEIQIERAEGKQEEILERMTETNADKPHEMILLDWFRPFWILILGGAALLTCLLVPLTAAKAAVLAAWLILFGVCTRHYLNKKKLEMEIRSAQEELETEEKKIREILGNLQWKRERILEEVKEKETIRGNLTEAMQEIRAEEEKAESQELEIDAVCLAAAAIKDLSDEIYKESARKLNKRISEILQEITGGRYSSVFLNSDLEVRIHTPEKLLSLEQVSRGTMDQIYFALRMAAGEILSGGEKMPVILDDAFAMYDDERMEKALKWLKKSGRQVLLFSCHKREKEVLQAWASSE